MHSGIHAFSDWVKFLHQISLPNKRSCRSSKGWLIVVERDLSVTLINSFRRVKGSDKKDSIIYLPPLYVLDQQRKQWAKDCHYVHKATYYYIRPNIRCRKLYGCGHIWGIFQIGLFRLRNNMAWTYVEFDHAEYHNPLIEEVVQVDQDKFSVAHASRDELLCCDINTQSTNSSTPKLVQQNTLSSFYYFIFKNYLVYSIEKELLMIYRYAGALRKESLSYETLKFKIFKLSFEV